MSSLDIHPEDLLDRMRRGQATAIERERVDAHLAQCEACRFEQALLSQSMRDASAQPGDAARARAIEQRAVAVLAARTTRATQAGAATHKRKRRAAGWLAAAVVSSIATAAAAAVIAQPTWLQQLLPTLAPAVEQAPARTKTKPKRVHVVAPMPAPVPVPAPVPTTVTIESEQLAPTPSTEPALIAKPAPEREDRSAAEMFAAANAARREREPAVAVRLYRELSRAHPRSSEASVARVALGRLLLDRVGDARSALREFDAYLGDGQASLREDALIGRALALGRLERKHDELVAWNALLQSFPTSAYAERARTRVEALR